MGPRIPLLTALRAVLRPKERRSPRQQAALDIARNKLKPKSRKPRFECQYCSEQKLPKEFINGVYLPGSCQPHLTGASRVCKPCLEASMSAQLDCKRLFDIGCPQCGTASEPEDVRMLLGSKDSKRFKELEEQAVGQVYVPDELPDQLTLDDMLARGARLCPCCRFPFVKLGGCDSMLCK